MALLAGLWEATRNVIRVGGALEVCQVATHARRICAGQVVVPIHVALCALSGRVRPSQGEPGGRVVEIRAHPRGGVVALRTGLREPGLHVVGVGRALEILQVAAHASCICAGQAVVVVHVALHALHGCVRAGQRESRRRMVKTRARPRSRVVALRAGLREPGLHVVRLRRALEVFQVATDASRVGTSQVVVPIHVALSALRGRVRPGQGEPGGRVVEIRAHPRGGVVALRAGLREPGLHVVRVGRALEILQVAAHASCICAGQAVVVVGVALDALNAAMRTRQRETGGRVIESRARPRGGVVALRAGLREPGLHVIRLRRALEILQVAAHASCICTSQAVVAVYVTLRALHSGMGSR